MTALTTDILSLSGDELDALVAERVMGWKVHRYKSLHTTGWIPEEVGVIFPFEPSRKALGMERVLDRMIALGWNPSMDYDKADGGWLVVMCGKGDYEDAPKFTSMNLNEAVCKAALIAVGA